jgi:Na+/H+ antiporter NhaB
MVDTVVISTLYFISVFQLILQAGVVFYAYRVTKLTGSFRAWTLIIAAFTLLTIRNVVSLFLSLSLPADQLSALIDSIGVVTLIASSAVNIAAGVALFLGMLGLAKRFENQSKAPQ